jgi:hypothetical protein
MSIASGAATASLDRFKMLGMTIASMDDAPVQRF